ncbi:MAG: type VI secretion system baseplate subunit TssF [Pseudomonadota bacterium]
MDRAFLTYYESELTHLRELAVEFSQLHPTVARNLSLDAVPCPDPYVERLLEGVAYLGARSRAKLDWEASRHVRMLLDALYPDLAAPAPAMSLVTLEPGPQVGTMQNGHIVPRGTRLMAGLRDGLSTRAVYTTAQDVPLWPVQVAAANYLPDRGALNAAGIPDNSVAGAEAGISISLSRNDGGSMAELSLDQIDLCFAKSARAGALFDAVFGFGRNVVARAQGKDQRVHKTSPPAMIGLGESEALLPRVRASFEGYRLLREYFLMPERFYFVRLAGLNGSVREAGDGALDVIILLSRTNATLNGLNGKDFVPYATPIVNLFERECNIVDLDKKRSSHAVHADRTRPRDFEIYRLKSVADAARDGPQARIADLFALDQQRGQSLVFTTERRQRRASNDERTAGQYRTSYPGDDLFISVARPPGAEGVPPVERLDIRALCTNRDLPILDDMPTLSLETGDPVTRINVLQTIRKPRAALSADLRGAGAGEATPDDLTWRWIAQLSLSQLCLSEDSAMPLQALVRLYADRGDPAFARHGRSIETVSANPVVDRIDLPGPVCFAHGTEVTFGINDAMLSGGSHLLLSALLAHLLTREAAINSFIRAKTVLVANQEEVSWPATIGTRKLI